ncbi:MAG: proteasome subunit beta [Candidatus Woesearchaeota archaeon]
MTEQVKTGTTTIGIVCSDGIVIAADKRATAGNFIARSDIEKVIPINDTMVLTIAGVVSDAQKFIKYIKAETRLNELQKSRKNTPKEVANLIGNLTYGYLRYQGAITHFLFAAKGLNGDYELYDITPDGVVWKIDTYVSSGSGSIFALSVLDDQYKKGLSIQDGLKLVKQAINAALRRDSASGNGADIYTITEQGVKHEQTVTVSTELPQ